MAKAEFGMNTRSEGLGGRLDELMWKLARAVRGWL